MCLLTRQSSRPSSSVTLRLTSRRRRCGQQPAPTTRTRTSTRTAAMWALSMLAVEASGRVEDWAPRVEVAVPPGAGRTATTIQTLTCKHDSVCHWAPSECGRRHKAYICIATIGRPLISLGIRAWTVRGESPVCPLVQPRHWRWLVQGRLPDGRPRGEAGCQLTSRRCGSPPL